MSKVPPCLDPYLLKDELLAALRQSPLTSQLVPLRAEEIIQIIMQKPIVIALEEQVRTLKLRLQGERVGRKTLRSDSKRHWKEQEREVGERDRVIRALNEEIQVRGRQLEGFEDEKLELEGLIRQYQGKISDLQHQNQQYQQESKELKKNIEQRAEIIQKLEETMAQKVKTLSILAQQQQKRQLQSKRIQQNSETQLLRLKSQIQKAKQIHHQQLTLITTENKLQIQQRDTLIQTLKQERFNLKNQINGLKIDIEENAKLTDFLKGESQQLTSERNKLKQTIKLNKIIFDKQRKMVNQRMHELTIISRSHQKLKANLSTFYKAIGKLQGEYQKMVGWVKQQLQHLADQTQTKARNLLDQVGSHVEGELRSLYEKLNSKNQEVRTAKNQIKMREDILQRSEKIGVNYNKEIAELKGELRQRKREEERLRRQLKTNYEEYQAKLSKMEKKYVELLNKGSF